MKITVINKENLSAFSSMLHDEDEKRITSGLPVAALGVVDEESAIGVLTGQLSEDDTFTLTNIFVAPGARRMGAGTMLLDALLSVLGSGVSVEAEVFGTEGLRDFLLSRGFDSYTPDDSLYTMSLMDAIIALEPHIAKLDKKAKSFSQFLPSDVKAAGLLAIRDGLPIPAGGFPSAGIDEDLSSLIYEDGKLGGYLIIDRFQDDHLTISGLYAEGNPKNIGMLFANTLERAENRFDEKEIIMVPVISSQGERLLKRLFPKAKKLSEKFCLYRFL